jgi:hypothetical protein
MLPGMLGLGLWNGAAAKVRVLIRTLQFGAQHETVDTVLAVRARELYAEEDPHDPAAERTSASDAS